MRTLCKLAAVLILVACGPTPQQQPTPTGMTSSTSTPGSKLGTTAPSTCHARAAADGAVLNDLSCTPGALNANVTQASESVTICKSGWTATIRPPASYTDQLKRQQIIAYGFTDTNPADYEEDHLISLELGGNPTDPHNLWPQPHAGIGSTSKDHLENYLKAQVCAGKLPLADAQHEIATNWDAAWIAAGKP